LRDVGGHHAPPERAEEWIVGRPTCAIVQPLVALVGPAFADHVQRRELRDELVAELRVQGLSDDDVGKGLLHDVCLADTRDE